MKKFEHGGDIYSRKIVLDYSANINPFGMPNSVKKAIADGVDNYAVYPDRYCRRLRLGIAEREGVSPESVFCGNGAADLIFRLVLAAKPKHALLLAPTFSEYERALHTIDCEVQVHILSEENGFSLTEKILIDLDKNVDIFFLCNPNNPVGSVINKELLQKISTLCKAKNILFVIDECFLDFVENGNEISAKKYLKDGVIILKAFTKIYAMAGLRLGYILCENKNLLDKIEDFGQAWSVSTVAQTAGLAALGENEYLEKTIRIVSDERKFLQKKLVEFGFIVFSSETNFILFKSKLPLYELLLKEKIQIRSCENFLGLNQSFFRIAVKSHDENIQLIEAIKRITGE